MKKIRKLTITIKTFIPLLILSLMLIFCIGTVSAEAGSNNTTNQSDNLSVSNVQITFNFSESTTGNLSSSSDSKNNQTLPDPQVWRNGHQVGPNYNTIQEAIDAALPGDTIMLENGAIFSGDGNTDITISKNLNFDVLGGGIATIDGGGTRWGFWIDPGFTITFNHIIFQNLRGMFGGAIGNNGTMTITGCTFINNTDMGNGGAIYNEGNLTVNNCTFTDNYNYIWLIIWDVPISGSGGAIYNKGNLHVIGSTFTGNRAEANSGGAIDNSGNLIVVGSTFTGNIANNWAANDWGGGAIHNSGTLRVIGSTFTGNIADAHYGYRDLDNFGGKGGAIFNGGTLIVTSSMFTSNKAQSGGGAQYPRWGFGGAIFSSGNLDIFSSTFANNYAVNNENWGGNALFNYGGNATSRIFKFNHIIGNSPGYSEVASNMGTLDATLNWWGSNSSPAGKTQGSVLFDPWIILTITANPTTINYGGISQITADILHDSANTYHNPMYGHVPDGIPITLTLNPVWGTITNIVPLSSTTLNGKVNSTYNTELLPIQTPVRIYANADSEQVYTEVNIPIPTNLTVSNPQAYNGETVNIIATLTRTDTGAGIAGKLITITVNGQTYTDTTDNNGQITWSYLINNTDAGLYTIHATFAGDTQYITSTEDGILTVDHIPTSLTMDNAGGAGSFKSQTVNIQATLRDTVHSDMPVSGKTIDFTITGDPTVYHAVTDVNGAATLVYTIVQDAGNYNIHATFTGDSQYAGYSSNPDGTLTVNKTPTNLTIDNVRGNKDETVTLKAVLKDYYGTSLTGKTVEFWVAGVKVGENTTDINGTAVFNYKITQLYGNHTIESKFNEDTDYLAINAAGELYVPKADLYIKITSSKNNPKVNETFTLTYKLGNKGPDAAENVTITIPLPEGFEYTKITGDGKWTYNATTRTITWTLENVPVGDPNLYISGKVNKSGTYVFGSSITSDTYNINTDGVKPITINAVAEVKAVSMEETGLPVNYLILAILMVISGLLVPKRK